MSRYRSYYKVVVVGDQEVGKSSISSSYVGREFSDRYIKTIGIDFYRKEVDMNDRLITFMIWDTSGDKRAREITLSSLRGSNIVIIVFDLTLKTSLLSLEDWIRSVKASISGYATLAIVGNKADLEPTLNLQAEFIAKQNNASYFQVSGKTGEGLNEIFEVPLKIFDSQTTLGFSFAESINLEKQNDLQKENSCC